MKSLFLIEWRKKQIDKSYGWLMIGFVRDDISKLQLPIYKITRPNYKIIKIVRT